MVGMLLLITAANFSFVYAQTTDFHIPKHEKMEGDTLVHHKGYSALYNTNYKVSRWISYKLTREQVKEFNTYICDNKENFYPDPLINSQKKLELKSFKKKGYHIGHLVKYCHLNYDSIVRKEANYFTNLVLQDPNNNKSLWNQAEQFTERVAQQFKEVYVINGCIFDSIPNQKEFTIAIPDKFFKILLVEYKNQYHAIGFKISNEEEYLPELVSNKSRIDVIENLTELIFFNNLDKSIQKKLKSDFTFDFWIENFGWDLKQ